MLNLFLSRRNLLFSITFWSLLISTIASGFLACSSGPALENFPRRQIDRPYTLPSGVDSWHIPTVFERYTFERLRFDEYRPTTAWASTGPNINPLIWTTSLSDELNLHWFLLPLGISYQIRHNENGFTGLMTSLNFGYSSTSGFKLMPTFKLSHRHKLSGSLAIDVTPWFNPNIPFKIGEPFYWSSGVAGGPLLQIGETFTVKPSASIGFARGELSKGLWYRDRESLSTGTRLTLGLGVDGSWSMTRQWDLQPAFHYFRVIGPNGIQILVTVIEFVHFW